LNYWSAYDFLLELLSVFFFLPVCVAFKRFARRSKSKEEEKDPERAGLFI
jgi:hypothetical protein